MVLYPRSDVVKRCRNFDVIHGWTKGRESKNKVILLDRRDGRILQSGVGREDWLKACFLLSCDGRKAQKA